MRTFCNLFEASTSYLRTRQLPSPSFSNPQFAVIQPYDATGFHYMTLRDAQRKRVNILAVLGFASVVAPL
jgi:hypothetical protein